MAGVYWIGQDGSYYVKAAGIGDPNVNNGVQKMGSSLSPLSAETINSLTQIQDPALGSGGGSSAPAGGGGTSPALNTGAVSNTQATLDQLPAILQAALASEGTTYGNATSGFDSAEAGQRKTYGDSTTTNQQNYDSTFMDSIRAGIKGLGGLMALLRGTGASGGSVDDQVRDTVGGVTANDIRGGADTRNENQTALDNSLATFVGDLGVKRRQAEDTHVNNERAIRRDNATQMQDLFGKMAGYYGDAGDTGTANTYMGRAGALTPEIAANSSTQVSPYDTTPVVVHAPNLTAFAAPTEPNVLAAPADGQVGSGIFTISNRRKSSPALAPAGA